MKLKPKRFCIKTIIEITARFKNEKTDDSMKIKVLFRM